VLAAKGQSEVGREGKIRVNQERGASRCIYLKEEAI